MQSQPNATYSAISISPDALRDARTRLQTMHLGNLLQFGLALGDGPYIESYSGMYRDRLANLIDDALNAYDSSHRRG